MFQDVASLNTALTSVVIFMLGGIGWMYRRSVAEGDRRHQRLVLQGDHQIEALGGINVHLARLNGRVEKAEVVLAMHDKVDTERYAGFQRQYELFLGQFNILTERVEHVAVQTEQVQQDLQNRRK